MIFTWFSTQLGGVVSKQFYIKYLRDFHLNFSLKFLSNFNKKFFRNHFENRFEEFFEELIGKFFRKFLGEVREPPSDFLDENSFYNVIELKGVKPPYLLARVLIFFTIKMATEDLYKDEEEENDKEKEKWVSVNLVNNEGVLNKIAKNLVEIAKSTINYAKGTTENLKQKGIYFDAVCSLKAEGKKVEVSIIFEPKAIEKEKLEELGEMVERERYIRQIRGKPRGIHTKHG